MLPGPHPPHARRPRFVAGVLRLLLPLLLALLPGCQSPRTAFPIGVYSARRTADFPELQAAGFNLLVAEPTPELLDAARTSRIGVIARPGTLAGKQPFDVVRAREFVRRYDRHPALRAWLLSDEPDLHDVPPSEVARARDALVAGGARKPTAVVLFDGNQAAQYAPQADWLIQDRYPIPWLPLADFSKHLRLARHAAGPRRPLYAVIQAFDWSFYPDLLPGESNLRPPTAAEIRAMTYLALVRGADGILYYTFDDGRWDLRRHPETWQAVRDVVAEVRLFEALFRGRPRWAAMDFGHPDRRSRRNEALDPAIQSSLLSVTAGDDFVPAGVYLVAVNTTPQAVPWRFRWHAPTPDPAPVLGESRELTPQARTGWYADDFGPFAVRVYGPLRPPKSAR